MARCIRHSARSAAMYSICTELPFEINLVDGAHVIFGVDLMHRICSSGQLSAAHNRPCTPIASDQPFEMTIVNGARVTFGVDCMHRICIFGQVLLMKTVRVRTDRQRTICTYAEMPIPLVCYMLSDYVLSTPLQLLDIWEIHCAML